MRAGTPLDEARTARSRFAAVGVLASVFLTVALLTRIVLLVMDHAWRANGFGAVVRAFAVGEIFDLTGVLWLLLPFTLYMTLVTDRWLTRRWHRRALMTALTFATGFALFIAAVEVLFFDEFNGRFNFVAVDYLIYPTEVVTNIWESYPVLPTVLGILAAAIMLVYRMRRPLLAALTSATPQRTRVGFFLGYGLVLTGGTLVVSPSLSRVSHDRALNEIAENGYYSFWAAFMGRGASYDALYATRDPRENQARVRRLLSVPGGTPAAPVSDVDGQTSLRQVRPPGEARKLNVVVVLEESLGSAFVGALHPRDSGSYTPHLDSLIGEGTLLAHAYSTGNRTIRALEATTSSLPPLPGVSVVRRKESVNLFTLPSVLRARGYATEFIYGGRALFDGMGAYMRNNGMERVVEQRDFPKGTFTTAWGAADEAIFDKSLLELDSLHATGKPFYTLILSISNHKPYSYPAGRIAADPNARKRVNAVQYADWALGRFMRMARQHAFFDSTLFVLMGDHGARVYGAADIPLASYEVPILFYAPAIIPAGVRVTTLASSMDIPPTILGLLGGTYESKFFGRDVLHDDSTGARAVMTHNNQIAMMRGGLMAVLGLRGETRLFGVNEAEGVLNPIAAPDSAGRELVADAIAVFETADELYRDGKYRFDQTGASRLASRPTPR